MTVHDVLIVEDRPEIAARLKGALASADTLRLVGQAASLDHGLRLLFEKKPRVVLVDLGLPDGDGIELIKSVAKADWTIDALVVSNFGDETRVVEAIRAGARGYILKGDDLGTIDQDIIALIEGGSPISPAIARHVLNLMRTELSPADEVEIGALTPREVEILRAVARGYKRREIAKMMGITPGTVGNHVTNIYRKLEVGNNIEAISLASKIGLV